jgi:DNA invertase Pin-like site-specific DNA recombinase
MQNLLNDVESGMWEGVLVVEVERLARGDTMDQGLVSQTFKISGTKIITPVKIYDPNNEFDEEYFEFNLFMARREYKMINRRIQRGRVQSASEGLYLGSVPPYGYDKVKIQNGRGYTLAPNPGEAEVIRLIYNLYVEGVGGAATISRILDTKGFKPRSNESWSNASIKDILKNPVYAGDIRWGNVFAKGVHPPIVDRATYEKAQHIMKNNYRPPTKLNYELQNPLAGIVYCKKCGALMTRLGENTRNQYATLKCPNKYCNNVSAPIFLVEDEILNSLRNWLDVYKIDLDEGNLNPALNAMNNKQKIIAGLKNELKKVASQIAKTYELLEQEVYSVDVFLERNQSLKEKQEDLLSKIAASESEIEEQQQSSFITVNQAEALLNSYSTSDTASDRNQILKLLVSRVTYIKNAPNRRGQLEHRNFEIEVFPILPTKN